MEYLKSWLMQSHHTYLLFILGMACFVYENLIFLSEVALSQAVVCVGQGADVCSHAHETGPTAVTQPAATSSDTLLPVSLVENKLLHPFCRGYAVIKKNSI